MYVAWRAAGASFRLGMIVTVSVSLCALWNVPPYGLYRVAISSGLISFAGWWRRRTLPRRRTAGSPRFGTPAAQRATSLVRLAGVARTVLRGDVSDVRPV